MSSTITDNQSFVTQLQAQIEYPHTGVLSKVLVKDKACQYTLFCLAANTEISEHTSTRNATVNVIQGRGLLTLSGKNIVLEPGVLVFMPANAPHALQAEENLAFLLILSEKAADSN
jgi:quercetin dioxygenase-like cupin family protein